MNSKHLVSPENVTPSATPSSENQQNQTVAPAEYYCPISGRIMVDPVVLSDGNSYERENALRLLEEDEPISPLTREALDTNILLPNRALKGLIDKFLVQHPEFKVNPISDAIAKSLSKPDITIEDKLLDIIKNNPDALVTIEAEELETQLRAAYRSQNFVTFFVILNHFTTAALKNLAIQLMSTPTSANYAACPNVFFEFAEQEDVPIAYLDKAIDLIGFEESQKIIKQEYVNYPTIFQYFWMHKYYDMGKSILTFYKKEEQIALFETKINLLIRCADADSDDEDSDAFYTETYSNLLTYLLEIHPTRDITETLQLMKMVYSKEDREISEDTTETSELSTAKYNKKIEETLLQPNNTYGEAANLIRYVLRKADDGFNNVIMLAESCSQQVINDAILKPFKERKYAQKYYDYVYSNFIHKACDKNDVQSVLILLRLLKTDAYKALLCPWKNTSISDNQITEIIYPNAIQFLCSNDKINLISDIQQEQFLSPQQILEAMLVCSKSGHTIFNYAVRSLSALQYCISLIGIEQSRQMLSSPKSFDIKGRKCLLACINQVIYNSAFDGNIITLIITTLGDTFKNCLTVSSSIQEHIFISLCAVNKPKLTEMILSHIDDVNLLIRACRLAIIPNKEKANTEEFLASLIKYIINLLKTKKCHDDLTIVTLMFFAMEIKALELLSHCLTVYDAEKTKIILLQARTRPKTDVQFNIMTYALYKNAPLEFFIKLVNALQDKALETIKTPYSSNLNFIDALLHSANESLYGNIFALFNDINELKGFMQKIINSHSVSSKTQNLLGAIQLRIFQIMAASENYNAIVAAVPQSASDSQKKSEAQLAGQFLSLTLNPSAKENAKEELSAQLEPSKEDCTTVMQHKLEK